MSPPSVDAGPCRYCGGELSRDAYKDDVRFTGSDGEVICNEASRVWWVAHAAYDVSQLEPAQVVA